jgi:hypothetical protein
MIAEMAKKTGQKNTVRKLSGENTAQNTALDHYRQIGIPAVAAAARYQGVAKNPAYAPAPTKWHDHTGEAA